MEESPSGGCHLGDKSSDTETWAHCVGAHGQEPMKYFETRSMMQEHHSLVKRASAWTRERQLDQPANFFLNFTLRFVAPNINELMS
jgi:hypothetical protein